MSPVSYTHLDVYKRQCFYYGEEIGMQGVKRSYKYALDPLGQKYKHVPRFLFDMINESINRDEMRTPMQWDTTNNAGFSSGQSTWLHLSLIHI